MKHTASPAFTPHDGVREFVERIPTPELIRARLTANAAEARLLKRLLRLSIERENVGRASEVQHG